MIHFCFCIEHRHYIYYAFSQQSADGFLEQQGNLFFFSFFIDCNLQRLNYLRTPD